MSFDKHSNFNKQANFTGVKFGENKPVLEVELNELQEIQNEARADIVRDSIPSGFVQLGDLDFEYMKNNENQVKLKTDSVAYVNGYKINIPKDTIINIGKAPEKEAREDLVFLEVWKEEVTSDSVITKNGGEGQEEIPNKIKDDRYPIETSHRVALKWRIRHVADVDFNNNSEGLGDPSKWGRGNIYAQASLSEPYNHKIHGSEGLTDYGRFRFMGCWFSDIATNYIKDMGLYTCGDYSSLKVSERILGAVGGYVYAIPMFRLYRKPSCGKSIPFEYNKINPKVDYSKFTALMKEEKVERVVSETIKGNSLVNLMNNKPYQLTHDHSTLIHEFTRVAEDVTIIVYNLPSDKKLGISLYEKDTLEWSRNDLLTLSNSNPKMCYLPKLPNKMYSGIVGTLTEIYGVWTLDQFKDLKIVALEGDWTNKEIPEYFEGLKSLGEEEHNLIEVKTGVIDENTYDPCDGNIKLSTAPNVTHVMSDNTIIPTIEAEVKRGETKLSDLTAFGKLETVGDETIKVNKVKGRTLQNLHKPYLYSFAISGAESGTDFTTVEKVNEITINRLTNTAPRYTYVNCGKIDASKLKPNTKYTVVFEEVENIHRVALHGGDTGNILAHLKPINNNKAVLTTISDFSTINTNPVILYVYIDSYNTDTRFRLKNAMIIEGDHTNTPLEELPYIEGIKSVGEQEEKISVKTCGKNLVDVSKVNINVNNSLTFRGNSDSVVINGKNSIGGTSLLLRDIEIKKGKIYTITAKIIKGTVSKAVAFNAFYTSYGYMMDLSLSNTNTTAIKTIEPTKDYVGDMGIWCASDTVFNNLELQIQMEESSTATSVEPYKEHKQEYYLKEPLRSLPNGVYDEVVGNKVIRRVGKIVLDETSKIISVTRVDDDNFVRANISVETNKVNGLLICDSVPYFNIHTLPGGSNTIKFECICSHNGSNEFNLVLKTQKVGEYTKTAFLNYFKNNPITVYYELANPVEEEIGHYYDKESVKTYQLEEPLRGLPNGVKDEIKDGVLIRRCDELVFNGTENWIYVDTQNNADTCLFAFKGETKWNLKPTDVHSISHISTQFGAKNHNLLYYPVSEEGTSISESGTFYVRINKNKLETQNVAGFKDWLKKNPVKVIYELKTPTETLLKEVHSNTADFSYERQLAEGNYLRELPNGVKDTIEDGKVIRRIIKKIFKDVELSNIGYESSNDGTNTVVFGIVNDDHYYSNSDLSISAVCNSFVHKYANWSISNGDTESIGIGSKIDIRINKSRLSSVTDEGFKEWLSKNPVTLIYQAKTPTEEALTTENSTYYPYHEVNTYCGSMYVGNGTNEVLVNSVIPKSEDIIINTPFREISGRDKVNDCRYKKVAEGYDTMYIGGNRNMLCIAEVKGMYGTVTYDENTNTYTHISDQAHSACRLEIPLVTGNHRLKPNKRYVAQCLVTTSKYNGYIYANSNDSEFTYPPTDVDGGKVFISANTDNRLVRLPIVTSNNYVSGKSSPLIFRLYVPNKGVGDFIKIKDLMLLEEDEINTDYEDFTPVEHFLENMEENDIEDLRHQVSLTGFNYDQVLNESFDKLLRGEL